MPFQSEAQRKFLWARHPEIAKRWAKEYPGQKHLPSHKAKRSKRRMKAVRKSHAIKRARKG